jgi:hypothetical protein
MLKACLFAGLALLLAACAGAGDHPESVCDTPPPPGETAACAYYPGYGWAHVPIYHGSAPGTSF